MNFNSIGNIASAKRTKLNLYNELYHADKIPIAMQPFIDT